METFQLEANGLRFSALAEGEGPVVLLLHGFPDHLHSFRHQLPALASAGFRAIAPAMRGYEASSQAPGGTAAFHPMRLADDLFHWATSLGAPVHLVGHDWGGIVAYLAAAQRPELFASMTTLAVPHFSAMREPGARRLLGTQLRNSWYVLFFQLRGLADLAVERNDFAFIERLWRDWSPGFAWQEQDMEALKQTFRQPGVRLAALSYYRAMMAPWLKDTRAMNALVETSIQVRTLALTGARDGCLDTRFYDHIPSERFPAGLQIERLEGVGHFLHQEAPDRVNALLIDFLEREAA